jgi:4-hydroxy-4-methyl-2-oxoglutarate aldolase
LEKIVMTTSVQENPAQRLARLDCCAVSDALDKLGLSGTVSGLQRLSTGRRISGRVVTVKLTAAGTAAPAHGAANAPKRHLGTTAIDLAAPGDIIVIEQRTGIDAGSWGGILSLGASLRGVAGVIVDGPVRDLDEAHQYGLPVFARGTTAFTARGRVAEEGTNVAVTIGTVRVEPGDFAIADASGTVFIKQADIERVLAAAERIVALEALMAKALLRGRPSAEVMGANYENMLGEEHRS